MARPLSPLPCPALSEMAVSARTAHRSAPTWPCHPTIRRTSETRSPFPAGSTWVAVSLRKTPGSSPARRTILKPTVGRSFGKRTVNLARAALPAPPTPNTLLCSAMAGNTSSSSTTTRPRRFTKTASKRRRRRAALPLRTMTCPSVSATIQAPATWLLSSAASTSAVCSTQLHRRTGRRRNTTP